MTIQEFIEKHEVSMTVRRVDKRPDNLVGDDMRHFKCVLARNDSLYTTHFSQGLAHTIDPTCADVLDCLAMDASSFKNAGSFEEFCDEFGYSDDSRRAEKIYKACGRTCKKLERFLGHDASYELMYSL